MHLEKQISLFSYLLTAQRSDIQKSDIQKSFTVEPHPHKMLTSPPPTINPQSSSVLSTVSASTTRCTAWHHPGYLCGQIKLVVNQLLSHPFKAALR